MKKLLTYLGFLFFLLSCSNKEDSALLYFKLTLSEYNHLQAEIQQTKESDVLKTITEQKLFLTQKSLIINTPLNPYQAQLLLDFKANILTQENCLKKLTEIKALTALVSTVLLEVTQTPPEKQNNLELLNLACDQKQTINKLLNSLKSTKKLLHQKKEANLMLASKIKEI